MGYEGPSLASLVNALRGPTSDAAHGLADGGRKRLQKLVKANTPVGKGPMHLRDSIDIKDISKTPTAPPGTWLYLTGVETSKLYGPYVEHGTGLWGPSHAKYVIRPKNPNGWLSWITEKGFTRKDGKFVPPGTRVFAKEVMHPGSPGQHMFEIGATLLEHEIGQVAGPVLDDWARQSENAIRRLNALGRV